MQRTIKAALVLASALLLASCDKDRENHYTIQRLAQVEESNADGSSKRVSNYTYFEDRIKVSTTLDGTPEKVSWTTYEGLQEKQTDSVFVAGVLQPDMTVTIYYQDISRSRIDSVVTRDAAGVETLRDVYSYDGNFYSIVTFEAGVQTTQRVISRYVTYTTINVYTYDSVANEWKFDRKEETTTEYDDNLTTITLWVDNVLKEKTIYQTLSGRIDYKLYIASGDTLTLSTCGSYIYETLTI